MLTRFRALICVAVLSALPAARATADEVEDFYRGRQISIVVGYSPGSGYDNLARALSRHLSSHMPGSPKIIVVNMPGAGSLTAANHLYNVAVRDGTEIGTFGRSVFMEPLLGNRQAKYDAVKFSWIGNVASETSVCVAWHTSAVKQFADLMTVDFAAGANAPGSDTGVFANLLKTVFGARINIVGGYPGGAEITRAIESGEVDGRCGWSLSALKTTKPEWLDKKLISVFVQLGTQRQADLPDVPLVTDFATTDRQRQVLSLVLRRQDIAWPFTAPPGLPPARLAALRKAFADTMADPTFIKDAGLAGVEVRPLGGSAVQAIVQDVYTAPEDVVKAVRELLNPP